MKIASSTISATVVHSAMRAQTRHPSLRTWVGADPRQHAAATPDNSLVRASEATRRAPVMERPKPPPVHGDGDAKSTSQSSCDRDVGAITPRLSMLRDLIERMTGIRLQAVHWREATAADAPPPSPQSTAPTQSAAGQPNWGAELEHQTVLEETESTQFAAQGIVRTADGQEIRFSVQLSMQRSYREASSTTVRMGNAVKPVDPLVINFNGTAAQLHGSRFDFDLDTDSTTESLPMLASGSGFLALDRNGNGHIDNGSELFGPTQGNGYSELGEHDQDGNGWIDENDAVFNQLRIWNPTDQGAGQLLGLREAGIGALSLQPSVTPFALKDGTTRCSGPYAPAASICETTAAPAPCSRSTWSHDRPLRLVKHRAPSPALPTPHRPNQRAGIEPPAPARHTGAAAAAARSGRRLLPAPSCIRAAIRLHAAARPASGNAIAPAIPARRQPVAESPRRPQCLWPRRQYQRLS